MQASIAILIDINGAPKRVSVRTLSELVADLGYGSAPIATAVNGTFVPAAIRGDFVLSDGDRVEVLSPRQGG